VIILDAESGSSTPADYGYVRPAEDERVILGSTAYPWADVIAADFTTTSKVVDVENALDKIKLLKLRNIHTANKNSNNPKDKDMVAKAKDAELIIGDIDKDTFPAGITKTPTQYDIADGIVQYNERVAHIKAKNIKRASNVPPQKLLPLPTYSEPKTGVSVVSHLWMITKGMQELIERVEALENK